MAAKAEKKEGRLQDHREASRSEKGCFARFLLSHNDAVLCVNFCLLSQFCLTTTCPATPLPLSRSPAASRHADTPLP